MDNIVIGEGYSDIVELGLCGGADESRTSQAERQRRAVEWALQKEPEKSEFAVYIAFYGSENRPTCDHAAIIIRPLSPNIEEKDVVRPSFDRWETLHIIDIVRSLHNRRQLELSYRITTVEARRFRFLILIRPRLHTRLRLLKYLAVHEPPTRYIPVWYDCLTFSVNYTDLLLHYIRSPSDSDSEIRHMLKSLRRITMAYGQLGRVEMIIRLTYQYIPILWLFIAICCVGLAIFWLL